MEGFPIRKTDTITLINILQKEIFSRFGKCERIQSDQGTQFTSTLFREMAEALKIQITCTPAYNPKSNPVERTHRDIKSALMALSLDKPEEWASHVPSILFAMRTSSVSSTGYTPFQLCLAETLLKTWMLCFHPRRGVGNYNPCRNICKS